MHIHSISSLKSPYNTVREIRFTYFKNVGKFRITDFHHQEASNHSKDPCFPSLMLFSFLLCCPLTPEKQVMSNECPYHLSLISVMINQQPTLG